ncbi:hypothetical protein Csa_012185 [Cucumis sativus]|uniref:Uncharacterized protein n=1 Tax=Cucumis sativus TaxID=3659 RepID=A0A0A0L365_CUCSA|nr:hypothetical protein Csa_012185 [Cucumis sativus]
MHLQFLVKWLFFVLRLTVNGFVEEEGLRENCWASDGNYYAKVLDMMKMRMKDFPIQLAARPQLQLSLDNILYGCSSISNFYVCCAR